MKPDLASGMRKSLTVTIACKRGDCWQNKCMGCNDTRNRIHAHKQGAGVH